MLSSLYRRLVRVTEKAHDPKRPRALLLSRRTFARALALIAFGGVARPASARVLSSGFCECDAAGQCTGGCEPNSGYCPRVPRGNPIAENCWCQTLPGSTTPLHVCDCHCPDGRWPYCSCSTVGYAGCDAV